MARQVASVVLVLALTLGGFVGARALGRHEAQRDSQKRAEVAATQVRGSLKQAGDLVEGLRQLLVGNVGARVTSNQFATLGAMLRPVDLSAAAWIEEVPASERVAYERRTQHRIIVAPGRAPAIYLPATLVTGSKPLTVPGIDLSGEPGLLAQVSSLQTLYSITSTMRGANGLTLLESAQRVEGGSIQPGYVVLFVPRSWLAEQAARAGGAIRIGRRSFGDLDGARTTTTGFDMFGRHVEVVVPQVPVAGAAVALPWVVLGVGLALAALTGAFGVNQARRARAQRELDRIFTVSRDLISITGFDRVFRRVNPAFEQVLGYRADELIGHRPSDLVHPDDAEAAALAAGALGEGGAIKSIELRYRCKNGSYRWFEWTATPVVSERLTYAVGRDVTERRYAVAEEAALRRVATLVAQGVRPTEVFDAVSGEIRTLLGADLARLMRYDGDGTGTVVAATDPGMEIPVGTRLSLEGQSVAAMVHRTLRPARIADYEQATGLLATLLVRQGVRSSVGTPIAVEGRIWGVTVAAWRTEQPESVLADAETRLTKFTELVATAIANAEHRAELTASRARLVAAADDARRRIERDLHDGTQQRLVSLAIKLQLAQSNVPPELPELDSELGRIAAELGGAVEELREISRGIHPAVLSMGGLRPALRTLARRSAIPVAVAVHTETRFPAAVEAAAYYVVSEALTNAAKHAHATAVHVDLVAEDGSVRVSIWDDGVGGADPAQGSGLVGLRDRVEALGGMIEIASPSGGGTALVVTLPLDQPEREQAVLSA
jgi:PAS domain S-box-containing protein